MWLGPRAGPSHGAVSSCPSSVPGVHQVQGQHLQGLCGVGPWLRLVPEAGKSHCTPCRPKGPHTWCARPPCPCPGLGTLPLPLELLAPRGATSLSLLCVLRDRQTRPHPGWPRAAAQAGATTRGHEDAHREVRGTAFSAEGVGSSARGSQLLRCLLLCSCFSCEAFWEEGQRPKAGRALYPN